MKKSLLFFLFLFCFIGKVNASTMCFKVPDCNGSTTVYYSRCYSLPVNTKLYMIVNTPTFSETRSMTVPVDYNSRYVTSDIRFYIPDIKGFIFKGYVYNESTIKYTSQIKVNYASSETITGYRCNISSSGAIGISKVTVGHMYTSFSSINLKSEWDSYDYELELIDEKRVLNGILSVNSMDTSSKLPSTNSYTSGYSFDGWYYDSKFTKPVETNVIVDLDFKAIYGGSYGPVSGIKTGYEKLTLYAKWSKTCLDNPEYKLSYETNGGNKISSEVLNVSIGQENSSKLPIPIKSGYTFEGWYYDKALTKKVEANNKDELKYTNITDSNGCPAIADMAIYAKWKKNTTANEDSDKEDTESDKKDESDKKEESDKKDEPDKKDESDKKEEKPEVIVCPNEEYYYKVIYNTNGGVELESVMICSNCEVTNVELPKSIRDGYVFDGWYYDENLIEKVDINDVTKLNYVQEYDDNKCIKLTEVNLYAKWVNEANIEIEDRKEYTIRYVTNGGTQIYNDSICFNCNTKTKIVNPEKEGFKFVGWYYDEKYNVKVNADYLEELEISSVLSESTTITLYAKWEIDKPETDKNFIIKVGALIVGILLILFFVILLINRKRKKKEVVEEIEVLGL